MSALQQALDQYLAIRRSLGYELRSVEWMLRGFLAFLDSKGASHITTELALLWVHQPVDVQPATRAARLGVVRRFAAWRSALDPRTEVPPEGLLPYRYRRTPPYIYSDKEIQALVRTARNLASSMGLRAHTYSTLFALLAVTGLRLSEALKLDRNDVDLDEGILNIRQSKFRKSRLVPVHSSTSVALKAYKEKRNQLLPAPATPAFFVSEQGTRITGWIARCTFAKVSRQVGLRPPVVEGRRHGCGPRLHDMRHRFAARTLIDWYRAGLDAERQMPKLAAYLGHVHVADTYWYLEAVPELLQLATERVVQQKQREEFL